MPFRSIVSRVPVIWLWLFVCAIAANCQTVTLPYRPVIAEYSNALDRIIFVAANPNQLHIFDPSTAIDTAINLPKPPLSLSVSLDGLHAAVGHDALVSYVNLQSANLEKTLPATVTVTSLVLGKDYVYVLTYSGGTQSIQIASGAITNNGVYNGTTGRLHPSGKAIYTTDDGSSPEHLQDLDVSTGPVTKANQGPYHGDYAVCGGVWFSPDGRRTYTGCGTVYQASPQDTSLGLICCGSGTLDTNADDLYWTTLAGLSNVRSLSESATLGRVAAIPYSYQYAQISVRDNQVFLYDSAYLEPVGAFQLPDFVVNANKYQAHGQQVFYNQAATALYVVMQADGSAGLLNDFAVQIFPLSTPQPCTPTFNTANTMVPASGTLGTVGITAPASCIHQASSDSTWIQVISGAYGSGDAVLNYIVRPNSGAARNGSLAIGGQTYTITQSAASAPLNLLTPLGYSLAGAAYSKALDRLVLIVSNPKELHIYDPLGGSDRIVSLPKPPLSVSVGPDGLSAAVGYDGWLSMVNLSAASITSTIQVFTDVHTLLLAGHGYVYAYPQRTWASLFSVPTGPGTFYFATAIYNGREPHLYIDGNTFYTEGSKWDISSGPAKLINQNLSGSICGAPFWLTEDGARAIGSCGKVYTTSSVASLDLQYNGSFSNATSIQWAVESAKLHSTAVIPSVGYSGTGKQDEFIQIYGDSYLAYSGELSLPTFTVGSASYAGRGRYAFFNSVADKLIVLEQADPSAKLPADYGVVVYSVTTPASGCNFTLGAASASYGKNGGLDSVSVNTGDGCIWQATSNSPWITVNSGAVGFGAGAVAYTVSPSSSLVARSGTLTIAGQTFTVTQAQNVPVLSIQKKHTGNFARGQLSATYQITVSNGSGAATTSGPVTVTETIPASLNLVSMQGLGWTCPGTAPNNCSRNDALEAGSSYPAITVVVQVGLSAPAQVTNQVSVSGGGSSSASASDLTNIVAVRIPGDFDGNGVPDLVWMNNSSRAVTVNYFGGNGGSSLIGWNWLNQAGQPGWHLAAVADFDGNGIPDLVWANDSTKQVTVNYYGGPGGTTLIGYNFLYQNAPAGWHIVGAGDFDNNGTPDLVWMNDTTNQVTVHYFGGSMGATLIGWNYLNSQGNPGWHVVAVADFNGDGVPDLVWMKDDTHQVTVHYYGGAGGATFSGWNFLNSNGVPGWHILGARDFDNNGTPDLVWYNDSTSQITVNYYSGFTLTGFAFLYPSGSATGWTPFN